MKAIIITIILALGAGSSLGMGYWKSEVAYKSNEGSSPHYVTRSEERANLAGEYVVLPPVTITAKRPRVRARAVEEVKGSGPQMHCGPWRALEQGHGRVRECDVW